MDFPSPVIGVIGGSGFYRFGGGTAGVAQTVTTPYGEAAVFVWTVAGKRVAFIARHGQDHHYAPHAVPYRAHLWALKNLGVTQVLATAAVGAIDRSLPVGSAVVVDQFIDMTKARPASFFDSAGVAHVDMTVPYCPRLRTHLYDALLLAGVETRDGGTYVCTEGPRLETPAEIRMYAGFGADVVGQTQVPEVVLARELGFCYAAVAIIGNLAAGVADKPLRQADILAATKGVEGRVSAALLTAIERCDPSPCPHCPKEATPL